MSARYVILDHQVGMILY